MSLTIRFRVDNPEDAAKLHQLTPRQLMIAWVGAARRLIETAAREKIGGDFGDRIARTAIMTDERDPMIHELYVGGENGYIAEHIHTGGEIRPKERRYLAIPVDRSVRGKYPREYLGDLFVLRKENRAYLAAPRKRGQPKVLWILKRSVNQRPRPWWPTQEEFEAVADRLMQNSF